MNTPVVFNYKEFPHLKREGILSEGNNKFMTLSLFLETCPKGKEKEVRWCLSESEQYCEVTERWIPSAWMCFIFADNEYDAMRKIVGNVRQWEQLKSLKWFKEKYALWEEERQMMQTSTIQQSLILTVQSGGAGSVSAAKMLMEQFTTGEKKKVGRPTKQKTQSEEEKEQDAESASVNSDMARVLDMAHRQANKK